MAAMKDPSLIQQIIDTLTQILPLIVGYFIKEVCEFIYGKTIKKENKDVTEDLTELLKLEKQEHTNEIKEQEQECIIHKENILKELDKLIKYNNLDENNIYIENIKKEINRN